MGGHELPEGSSGLSDEERYLAEQAEQQFAPIVLTRDLSSRTVHKRAILPDGGLMSLEGCNQDDAGEYAIVLARDIADDDPRCKRCFPA